MAREQGEGEENMGRGWRVIGRIKIVTGDTSRTSLNRFIYVSRYCRFIIYHVMSNSQIYFSHRLCSIVIIYSLYLYYTQ